MSSTASFSTLLFFAIGFMSIVAGVLLIRRGLWPQRLGGQPHCRACDYLLIGIESKRCPECGGMLSPLNIVRGLRHRRRGLAVVGIAILLFGLANGVAWTGREFGDIPWYHFKPTFLAMRDLRGGTFLAADAMRELFRREKAGDLSVEYERQIVELALAQQATVVSGRVVEELIQFLGQQYLAGHMTDAQKARFGQQSTAFYLRVRPVVVLGDPTPYQFAAYSRVCGPGFSVCVDYDRGGTAIDGKRISTGISGQTSGTGLVGGAIVSSNVEWNEVGKHQLSIMAHVQLREGSRVGEGPILFEEDSKVTANFEVVAKSPPGYFNLISDPKLGKLLQANIVPVHFHINTRDFRRLQGQMEITRAPLNIAFDVYARCAGHEFNIGDITCNKGGSTIYHIANPIPEAAVRSTLPSKIDLILRSNEKLGRNTIDQTDIWNGELIYSDVPVLIE